MRNGQWFWAHKTVLSSRKINSSGKLVYCALAYFANNESQGAFPSINTIAELVNLHRATVIRAIKDLSDNKFITKKVIRGKSTRYTLLKVANNNQSQIATSRKGELHQSQKATRVVAKENSNNTKELNLINNEFSKENSPRDRTGDLSETEWLRERVANKL